MSKKDNQSKSKKGSPLKGQIRRDFLMHAADLARNSLNTASSLDRTEGNKRTRLTIELEWRVASIVQGAAGKFTKKSARAWLRNEQNLLNELRDEMGLGPYRLKFKLRKSK